MNKSAVIGMSGGVDSSVGALILKKKGFKVTGIGLKLFDDKFALKYGINFNFSLEQKIEKASKTAKQIGIPFFIIDVSSDFKKKVLDYFASSYLKGKTPNPCVVCNQKIKFDALFAQAKKLKTDYIATGHYARITKQKNEYFITKAKDKIKDQSYFLCRLNKSYLKKIIFPLGNLDKTEVRKIAFENKLSTFKEKDSQDVCFKDKDYGNFIENFTGLKTQKGPIVNVNGKRIGTHKGLIKYTIGQRKGLGIAHKKPLYVIDIIPKKNIIIVGEKKDVFTKYAYAGKIKFYTTNLNNRIKVKIRSNHKETSVKLDVCKNKAGLTFGKIQPAVTPGQAAVFYQGNKIAASGWLQKK